MRNSEVMTYGGPYDSYTPPWEDIDGYLDVARYDHDEGCWVERCKLLGLAVKALVGGFLWFALVLLSQEW